MGASAKARAAHRFALDSSCIVPLVSASHVFHPLTASVYLRLLRQGWEPVITPHALAESYSTLTRLPDPAVRATPAQAQELLESNFRGRAHTPGMSGELAWLVVADLSRKGWEAASSTTP